MPPDAPSVVLITGASRGIGAALAENYAAPGRVLALLGRSGADLAAVAEICRAKGATVETGSVDVRDRAALAHWILAFDSRHPVSLAIANAGVSASVGPGNEPEDDEAAANVFAVNLGGAVASLAPLIRPMLQRRHGHLAVMCSLAALYPFPNTPSYSASKAALMVWARAVDLAWGRDGVVTTVICPGFVESDMSARVSCARPILMSAAAAAAKIRHGLDRRKRTIAFPRSLAWGVAFLNLMPYPLARFFLRFFHYTVRPAD